MKTTAFAVCLFLASATVAYAGWESICTKANNCPTIMMSVGCENANMCAIVGGYSNTPMSVYYSKDQFASLELAKMDQDSFMLMDIAIDTNGAGATAGMGLLSNSGLLYTTDVTEWHGSTDISFIVGQDMVAFGNGEFGYVGTTSTVKNTEGVLISSDGGKDWTAANWPVEFSNLTEARYGSFPSDQVLYVTGGNWPSNNEKESDCYALSGKTCLSLKNVKEPQRSAVIAANNQRRAVKEEQGYFALLTKSTDGGKTWKSQFQEAGKFYFNDISCSDTTHCFAVGEGFTDGPDPGARIYATSDGEKWERVFFSNATGASLMRVHAVSNTEAWAAGGEQVSGTAYGTFYHTTDGGKTWDLEGKVQFVGDVTGFHFVNSKLGFATGITEFQTSTILKYTA